jgi:hypothetical protein
MNLRKTAGRGFGVLAFVALAAACSDMPTQPRGLPAGPMFSVECQLTETGTYRCPPQSPDWGDGCDAYHYDCGGDDCIASGWPGGDPLTQGCSGSGGGGGNGGGDPGGGGGGGGAGGTAPFCPDFGCDDEESPPSHDDYIAPGSRIPDCTKAVLQPWEHAYCTSEPPSGERLVRTQNSLQRVEARGGECANIAAAGWQLLASGRIRYYPYVESVHGNYGGWGSPEIGVLLDTGWVDDFGGTPTGHGNFDMKLVHEIEHAMGRGHVEGSNETSHSASCAGFSG